MAQPVSDDERHGICRRCLLGVKIFLIADIRGYTSFTHEYGDEAAGRLTTAFVDMTGEVAAAHHGAVIDFKGDEVLVGFDSPRQAILAGVASPGPVGASTPSRNRRCPSMSEWAWTRARR